MKPLPHGCFQRRLSPADEPALLEFFHSHSKETVFQRYHYLFSEMTHKRAMSLLGVDQHRDVALAIFEMFRQQSARFTMDSAADLRTLAEYAESVGKEELAQSMRLETPIHHAM